MGVDLTLLPVDVGDDTSHTMLRLDRDYPLWERFNALDPEPFGRPLWCYQGRVPDGSHEGESCYGKLETDPYGKKITAVPSHILAHQFGDTRDHTPTNRATREYLRLLPAGTPVVLYWH